MTTLPTRKVTRLAPGVVSDPEICGGRAVTLSGDIPTAMLLERFLDRESIASLGDDYNLFDIRVEDAIRYEIARRLRLKGWLKRARES